jgi:hypothetical protein
MSKSWDRDGGEEASRALDVAGRRGGRVAAGDDRQLQLADLALVQPLAPGPERGIEAAIEADHDPRLLRGDLAPAGARPLQVEIHGLLAQHGLAGLDGGRDQRHEDAQCRQR